MASAGGLVAAVRCDAAPSSLTNTKGVARAAPFLILPSTDQLRLPVAPVAAVPTPVTVSPAPMPAVPSPVTTMPSPMTTMPVTMAPAHLLGPQLSDLFAAGDRGANGLASGRY